MIHKRPVISAIAFSSIFYALLGCSTERAGSQLSVYAPGNSGSAGGEVQLTGINNNIEIDAVGLPSEGEYIRGTATRRRVDTRSWPSDLSVPMPWHGNPTKWSPSSRSKLELFEQSAPSPLPDVGVSSGMVDVGDIDPALDRIRLSAIPGFNGLTQGELTSSTAPLDFQRSPADANIAAGPEHLVQVVNYAMAFYTKDGAHTQTFAVELGPTYSSSAPGFFEADNDGLRVFDPRCYYDEGLERFIVIATERPIADDGSQAWLNIAISDDDDPNGFWDIYKMNAKISAPDGSLYWADYPSIGFDDQAIYITFTLAPLLSSNPTPYGGVQIRVIDKSHLASSPTQGLSFTDLNLPFPTFAVQAAQMCGASNRCYFAELPFDPPNFFGARKATSIRFHTIDTPLTQPTLITHELFLFDDMNTQIVLQKSQDSFGYPMTGSYDTILGLRFFNLHGRNGYLYGAHVMDNPQQGLSNQIVRWYQFDVSGWPDNSIPPTIVQSGDIVGASAETHYMFPSIYTDDDENVLLLSGRVSDTQFASIVLHARMPSDSPGMMGNPVIIATSTEANNAMNNPNDPTIIDDRWGDYFDIAIDPSDGHTFWTTAQYRITDGNGWNTFIDNCAVGTCDADLNGDGLLNFFDVSAFLAAYNSMDPIADFNNDSQFDFFDVSLFLSLYNTGCP